MRKLTAGQWEGLLFSAMTAPMAIACGGLDVLAAVPGLALAMLLCHAVRSRLPDGSGLAAWLPGWVLVLELLFLSVAAAAAAAMAPACWTGGGSWPLFPLTLLVLAGAAAHQGAAAVGRCASVLVWICVIFFGVVLAVASCETPQPQIDGNWSEGVPVFAVALTAVCGLFLPAEKGRSSRLWLGVFLFAVPMLYITAGKHGELPFLTAVKGIDLFGVLRRFESLASAALTIGLFLALTVFAASAGEIFRVLGFRRISGAVVLAPAAALLFWIQTVPAWVIMFGCAIFWGLIPVSALIVVGKNK